MIYTTKSEILRSIVASEYLARVKADATLDLRTKINLVVNSVLFAFDWKPSEFSWKKPSTWFRFLNNSRTKRVKKAVKKFFSYPINKFFTPEPPKVPQARLETPKDLPEEPSSPGEPFSPGEVPSPEESAEASAPPLLNATLKLIPPDPKEVHCKELGDGESEFKITWDRPHLGNIPKIGPQGYRLAEGCDLRVSKIVSGTMNAVEHSIQFKPSQIIIEKTIGLGFVSKKLQLKVDRIDVLGDVEGSHVLKIKLANGKEVNWEKEKFQDTIRYIKWSSL